MNAEGIISNRTITDRQSINEDATDRTNEMQI